MLIEALLDGMHVAFPLRDIERVVRAVAVHAVPGAPGCLLGAIDVAGELVSIYDTRKLLGLPGRGIGPADRFLLTRVPARCGLVVDDVLGTVDAEPQDLEETVALRTAGVRGVARGTSGMLLVQDLRRLLALERAIPIASHD